MISSSLFLNYFICKILIWLNSGLISDILGNTTSLNAVLGFTKLSLSVIKSNSHRFAKSVTVTIGVKLYVNLGRMNVLYNGDGAGVNVDVIQVQIFTIYFYGLDFNTRCALNISKLMLNFLF